MRPPSDLPQMIVRSGGPNISPNAPVSATLFCMPSLTW